jgi:hypothetical protein
LNVTPTLPNTLRTSLPHTEHGGVVASWIDITASKR